MDHTPWARRSWIFSVYPILMVIFDILDTSLG
jgi:hypothetical protein